MNSPITDSPWFWIMLFSAAGLIALEVMDAKYRRRQAQLENQFQGRRWAETEGRSGSADEPAAAERDFSTPEETVIPLWPLRVIGILVMLGSAMLLARQRRRRS